MNLTLPSAVTGGRNVPLARFNGEEAQRMIEIRSQYGCPEDAHIRRLIDRARGTGEAVV